MQEEYLDYDHRSNADYGQHIAQRDLDRIVTEHHLWLESEGREGKRAHFRGMDIRHLNFRGISLPEGSFRGADASGVDFSEADLRGADLAEAKLSHSNFNAARLVGANLSRAQAPLANFETADCTSANMSNMVLSNASLRNTHMQGAVLREAILNGAMLQQAELTEASLRGASFTDANLENTNLSSADCRDVHFERTNFRATNLLNAHFRGAVLRDIDFKQTDFSCAIDVPQEVHTLSMQNERVKLQEEYDNLAQIQDDLERREHEITRQRKLLEEERQHLIMVTGDESQLVGAFRGHVTWFKVTSVIWMVITVFFVAFTMLSIAGEDFKDLKMLELGILFGGIGFLATLFGTTTWKAMSALTLMQRLADFRASNKPAKKKQRPVEEDARVLRRPPVGRRERAPEPAMPEPTYQIAQQHQPQLQPRKPVRQALPQVEPYTKRAPLFTRKDEYEDDEVHVIEDAVPSVQTRPTYQPVRHEPSAVQPQPLTPHQPVREPAMTSPRKAPLASALSARPWNPNGAAPAAASNGTASHQALPTPPRRETPNFPQPMQSDIKAPYMDEFEDDVRIIG